VELSRAGHDLEDLLRDLGLTGPVHLEREPVDQLAGVLRRVAHRGHPRALLGGSRLEQRPEELGLEVHRDEPREDLLRLRLVDEVAAQRGVGGLVALLALQQLLGHREHLLHGDALHER
jgi:hypothetical protein